MLYLLVLYWCSIIPLKEIEVLFEVCIVSEGKWSIIWGLYCIWRKMKYYLRFLLYVKEVTYIDKCSMPYTLHDSLASEVLSWTMVWPYRYNLALYVARGGVRCGFIPLEVWRQMTYTLHSHAFIEVVFADIVDVGKLLGPCFVAEGPIKRNSFGSSCLNMMPKTPITKLRNYNISEAVGSNRLKDRMTF
jgi:hypothetical protein